MNFGAPSGDGNLRKKIEAGAEPLRFQVTARTEVCTKHPDRNEDVMLTMPERGVFGVFDGASRMNDSDVIAQAASEAVRNFVAGAKEPRTLEGAKKFVRVALALAHEQVKEASPDHEDNVATTASIVKIFEREGKRYAAFGNVGDSPIYVRKADGSLRLLSAEHTLFASKLANPETAEEYAAYEARFKTLSEKKESDLSAAEDIVYRGMLEEKRTLTNFLGAAVFDPAIGLVELAPGEEILIMSDGVSDNLPDAELADLMLRGEDIMEAAVARSKGDIVRAKQDDMSFIRVQIESGPGEHVQARAEAMPTAPKEPGFMADIRQRYLSSNNLWEEQGRSLDDRLFSVREFIQFAREQVDGMALRENAKLLEEMREFKAAKRAENNLFAAMRVLESAENSSTSNAATDERGPFSVPQKYDLETRTTPPAVPAARQSWASNFLGHIKNLFS